MKKDVKGAENIQKLLAVIKEKCKSVEVSQYDKESLTNKELEELIALFYETPFIEQETFIVIESLIKDKLSNLRSLYKLCDLLQIEEVGKYVQRFPYGEDIIGLKWYTNVLQIKRVYEFYKNANAEEKARVRQMIKEKAEERTNEIIECKNSLYSMKRGFKEYALFYDKVLRSWFAIKYDAHSQTEKIERVEINKEDKELIHTNEFYHRDEQTNEFIKNI